jgi:Uma2 family endonuclease
MTMTTDRSQTDAVARMTLDDYLNYDDGTDTQYELVAGQLVVIPVESRLNDCIASFLCAYFLGIDVSYTCLSMKAQIEVGGHYANARQPDLMVLSDEAEIELRGAKHRLITFDMPPPLLVVEVVSPKQESRDYRHKRTEYASRHIPEYWIVDPIAQKVTVLEWVDGLYEEQVYVGGVAIVSPAFPSLNLTAIKVLTAGR